jgi:hypothetical protein
MGGNSVGPPSPPRGTVLARDGPGAGGLVNQGFVLELIR